MEACLTKLPLFEQRSDTVGVAMLRSLILKIILRSLFLQTKLKTSLFSEYFSQAKLTVTPISLYSMCVCVCARACVRACARACVRACVCVCIFHIVRPTLGHLLMSTLCVSFSLNC